MTKMVAIMGDDTYIHSLPLSCLPLKTRELLSFMLDTPKIILSDGPEKLPRDWRGLAYLVNVSSEKAAYIQLLPHKTIEVLEIWQRDCNPTVGQLLQYLERLDRYDVYDDLCNDLKELLKKPEPTEKIHNQLAINNNNINNNNDQEVFSPITYDDRPGYEHHYDGFVLYAKEDKQFVNELLQRMSAEGFQLCTEDKLQAGHMTPYAPVTQLILKRCQRIILICSPEFVSSQANTFYRDYAQAVSIESSHHKIIPIMYRECQLPSHLAFYHKLYYNENEDRAMYDFWFKLKQSLEAGRIPRQLLLNRLNGITASTAVQPQIKIEELPSNHVPDYTEDEELLFLPRTTHSNSWNGLDSLTVKTVSSDCNSLSNFSQKSGSSDEKKKKPSKLTYMLKKLRIKSDKVPKSKKAIMLAH